MINSAAIDLVMKHLGGRQAALTRVSVVAELNLMIRTLERGPFKPWFLETELTQADVPLVVGQEYIELPSDFLMEVDETGFYINVPSGSDPGWVELRKVNLNKLRREAMNADAAVPEAYALFGKRVYLAPKPDVAYDFKWPYLKKTPEVADNGNAITNDWLLEFQNYTLLETAIAMASKHVQSAELVQKLQVEMRLARTNFENEVEARKHANMDYLLTDEEN